MTPEKWQDSDFYNDIIDKLDDKIDDYGDFWHTGNRSNMQKARDKKRLDKAKEDRDVARRLRDKARENAWNTGSTKNPFRDMSDFDGRSSSSLSSSSSQSSTISSQANLSGCYTIKGILKMAGKSLPIIPIIISLIVVYNLFFNDDEKETIKTKVSNTYEEVKKTVKEEVKAKKEIVKAKKEFEKTKTEGKTDEQYGNTDDKYGQVEDKW